MRFPRPELSRLRQAGRAALAALAPLAPLAVHPAEPGPVRIGYAISRTGPFAAGAQVLQEPNDLLWAEQVNAAGGLAVKGQRGRGGEGCRQSVRPVAGGQGRAEASRSGVQEPCSTRSSSWAAATSRP